MADDKDWAPKTRDDWVGLFADGMKTGLQGFTSEREEAEAKNGGKENDGKEGDKKDDEPRSRSLADRILGL